MSPDGVADVEVAALLVAEPVHVHQALVLGIVHHAVPVEVRSPHECLDICVVAERLLELVHVDASRPVGVELGEELRSEEHLGGVAVGASRSPGGSQALHAQAAGSVGCGDAAPRREGKRGRHESVGRRGHARCDEAEAEHSRFRFGVGLPSRIPGGVYTPVCHRLSCALGVANFHTGAYL